MFRAEQLRDMEALDTFRSVLASVEFPLTTPGAQEATAVRADIVSQLDDYILPRAAKLDAPLLAVVGGSTGAGKSTLVNSILGESVTRASAIRPTTRRPVLVFSPDDREWFASSNILPGLARVSGETDGESHSEIALVESAALPSGLALLDAPDIDSVVEENRLLAAQLMAAADLWIFVTTAARYADAVPWAMLDEAAERHIVAGVVLNRVPTGVGTQIRSDLVKRLEVHHLEHAPLFMLAEHVTDEGFVPEEDVAAIRGWLEGLTADKVARENVARQTLQGAISAVLADVPLILTELGEQHSAHTVLRDAVLRARAEAEATIFESVENGSVIRGEVLRHWNEVVGTGALMRSVEGKVSGLRDRVTSWFTGRKNSGVIEDLGRDIEDSLTDVLVRRSEAAVRLVSENWRASAIGRVPLASVSVRSERERRDAARLVVATWRRDLARLIESEGASKKATARGLSLGINVVGAATMIVVFASTAGLTGAETAIAGGGHRRRYPTCS